MAEWFGPKETGVGIRTWQGWLATAVFLALLFGMDTILPAGIHLWVKLAYTAAVITGFLALVWATYERDDSGG